MTRLATFTPSRPQLTRAVAPVVDELEAIEPPRVRAQRLLETLDAIAYRRPNPVTGCRADTLFGDWAMPFEHLAKLNDAAWAVVEGGELEAVSARSRAMDEESEPGTIRVEDGIAHISVSGPLTKHRTSFSSMFGGTAYSDIREQLKTARAMHASGEVKGVFVDADSWGGTVEGCSECVEAFEKTNALMPVVFHAPDKCTSAMQWLATGGRRITGGRQSFFGSVGAMSMLLDRSGEFKQRGRRAVVVASGPEKLIGADGLEITPEQVEVLQARANKLGSAFVADVAKTRNLTDEQRGTIARAGVFIGDDAIGAGLADGICTREQALAELKTMIGGAPGGGAAAPPPAAPIGATTMSTPATFTTQQLARAAKIPGCENSAAETAPEIVLSRAEALHAQVGTLTTERDSANKALTEAQAKIPGKLDANTKLARADGARARITALAAEGKLNKAMGEKLNTFIGKPGEENEAALAGEHGKTTIDVVLGLFAEAPRMAPEPGARSGVQIPGAKQAAPAQGVTVPEAGGDEKNPHDAGKAQGEAWKNAQLAARGVK